MKRKKIIIIRLIILIPILLIGLWFTWENAPWQKSTDLSQVSLAKLRVNETEQTIKQEYKEFISNKKYSIAGLNFLVKHGQSKTWWYKGDLDNQFFNLISYQNKIIAVFISDLAENGQYIQYMTINGENFSGKNISEISSVFGKNYIIRRAEQSSTYLQYIDKVHHLTLTFQLNDSKKVVGIVLYNNKFVDFTP